MLLFPNVFYCLLLDFIKSDPPAVLWDADGFCYEKSFTHLLAIPKRELAVLYIRLLDIYVFICSNTLKWQVLWFPNTIKWHDWNLGTFLAKMSGSTGRYRTCHWNQYSYIPIWYHILHLGIFPFFSKLFSEAVALSLDLISTGIRELASLTKKSISSVALSFL